jgi:hypothetical protein
MSICAAQTQAQSAGLLLANLPWTRPRGPEPQPSQAAGALLLRCSVPPLPRLRLGPRRAVPRWSLPSYDPDLPVETEELR